MVFNFAFNDQLLQFQINFILSEAKASVISTLRTQICFKSNVKFIFKWTYEQKKIYINLGKLDRCFMSEMSLKHSRTLQVKILSKNILAQTIYSAETYINGIRSKLSQDSKTLFKFRARRFTIQKCSGIWHSCEQEKNKKKRKRKKK